MSRQNTLEAITRLSDFDIDEDDDLAIAQDVIHSFGLILQDPDAHRRSVRFLHALLERYLWTWASLGCESPGPTVASHAVQQWLSTGDFTENFSEHCLPVAPIRDGIPVEDCDEPALRDLASASARLAYFCKTRNSVDAAIVLMNLFWADAEGMEPKDETEFVEWLSTSGVAVAWPE